MPRERKGSSSDDSGGSSSGESSGSDSSATEHSKQETKRTPKKDTSSSKSKAGDSTPGRSRRGDDDDSKERHKKVKAETGDLSSSDGEHIPRSGPRSTVVQKVSAESKDKGKKRDEADKASPGLDSSKDKHEDRGGSRSKKRSHSQSPRNRDNSKRWKEDRSSGRSNDRREERRSHRDERDSDRGRSWREGDRRRTDNRRRDEDRRGDGSRRDADRDRYDRKRDRDSDKKADHRSDRNSGEKRRDRDDREKDRGSRREENKENKKNENLPEAQKRKAEETEGEKEKVDSAPPEKKAKETGDITTRTGGAYIPPAKLRMMQAQITDKSSVEYQRMAWEALKKSINGLVNKVNVSNIVDIVREVFQENIVRGRGLLSRSVIQAQAASPTFTHVYAALVAIINTKFPQIGELILRRLILQFKRGFRRNDKSLCLSSTRFVAHLVNQQVAHEVIALEILTLLLENTTEDSVEVAISFLKESGQKLTEVSPRGINAIFERLRTVLHEAQLEKRVQYMVEVMFAIRKDGFKAHPAIISDLDLVEEDDQFTHLLQLDDVTTGQEQLNVFKADDDYLENEEKYKELKKEILDEGSSDEGGSGDESGSEDSSDDDDEEKEEGKQEIIDQTETNMVALRRTIYLTIQSSLDFEECAHKLLKMELKPGQEVELCYMILDCCAQLRTYEKFFGLLAQRFCQLDRKYVEPFQTIFREQFETIHRLDTNKLRNVAKFFAHLLHTDAISWAVMSCMKLTEEDTTSASRIFIKILFLELSEYMGLPKLNNRLRDPTLQEFFEGILPRSNPKDTRFAINFFTTIGLGGLTEDLREHLKGISKQLMQHKQQQEQQQKPPTSSSDSSDSDSSDSDSSDSSDSGSSDSSDSDSDDSDSSSDSEMEKKKGKTSKTREVPKDKPSRSHSARRLERQNSRHDSGQTESAQGRHSNRDDGRSRIEDKLLKLSLPKGMSLVDPSAVEHKESPPPSRKNRDKSKKKKGRGNARGGGDGRGQRRRRNSDRKRRLSNSMDQGVNRDLTFFRGERDSRGMTREDLGRPREDMMRGRDDMGRGRDRIDREDMGRGRPPTPPPARRRQDGYGAVEGRGGRRDLSPGRGMARWDDTSDRPDGYFQQRGDRMDLEASPPPRGGDRHGRMSPTLRRDRQDFEDFPPARRHDRLDLDEGAQRPYDRQDLDLDSRYDSLPRGQRRRESLSPPPRMGRREMDSPPRRLDSPPRHSGRLDVDRGREDFPRGRGDLDRNMDRGRDDMDRGRMDMDRGRGDMDRGRGDMDRGRVDMDRGRVEVDRSVDRGRRDLERERNMDRARGDMDRSRDMERGLDRGRGEVERGRSNVRRSLERGRGDLDWDRDFDQGMERGRNMERNGERGRVDMDVGRGNVSKSMERGRGDVDRGRGDLDRGIDRRDDRELDRGRGDRDRGRMELDRSRDDADKGRMVEREMNRRDRSRGQVEPESPVRQSRRELTHSPPLTKRRDMNRDQYRETDDRSVSPPARKEKVRERNDDGVAMRRSLSRDKKERRKTSQRNKEEGRRDRSKEKRHR
ncbi:uncharacterized protein LOC143285903 [Babylonia areolata]|uniref:uncharacterized protein LOC143285903 n=1 Tax=Babylonia areolata TaxID=304850 RepID=UPI003FD1CCBE